MAAKQHGTAFPGYFVMACDSSIVCSFRGCRRSRLKRNGFCWQSIKRTTQGTHLHTATISKIMDAMRTGEPVADAFDASVIRAEFERAVERAPSMSLLLLSTSDGRVISDWSRSDIDPRRLAAMTNSLLTLGETVARELGMPSAEYATVCTREGNMVMVRLDGPRPMTLAAMATAATNIGALLFVARECAASLQARLMPLP